MTNSNAIVVQSAAACSIADAELEDLLQRVYVQGGFTDPEAAQSLFAAGTVRARGEILVVRGPSGSEELRGMVNRRRAHVSSATDCWERRVRDASLGGLAELARPWDRADRDFVGAGRRFLVFERPLAILT